MWWSKNLFLLLMGVVMTVNACLNAFFICLYAYEFLSRLFVLFCGFLIVYKNGWEFLYMFLLCFLKKFGFLFLYEILIFFVMSLRSKSLKKLMRSVFR